MRRNAENRCSHFGAESHIELSHTREDTRNKGENTLFSATFASRSSGLGRSSVFPCSS
jgi:hypothetical protein